MSKIKKAADAKKITSAIKKAKTEFPDKCMPGNKIVVSIMKISVEMDISEFMEDGVSKQIDRIAKNSTAGLIYHLTLDDNGQLTVVPVGVDVVDS